MPLRWRIRHWLSLTLPRWLAVALAIRRLTPTADRASWPGPEATATADPIDTGGGYRADNRRQDPGVDPKEPNGGESGSVGNDHGWSGCTLSSGATALAYQQPRGNRTPWGGDLRHRQSDQSGGTDLYDLREAWASYGEDLVIKSGSGWGTLRDTHDAGRAIVIQGTGNVPGSATFDGGHACIIGPETNADGDWLWGDPLVSGWQWIDPDKIKSWAQAWASDISYAAGEKPPPPPDPPEPPDPPPPPKAAPPPTYAEGYADGVADGANREADRTFASWNPGAVTGPLPKPPGAVWDGARWAGTPSIGPVWSAGWPIPLGAVVAAQAPPSWQGSGWAASVWRD